MKEKVKRFGSFVTGKGFYIVLFLCIAAIGVSVWVMFAANLTGTEGKEIGLSAESEITSEAGFAETEDASAATPEAPAVFEEPVGEAEGTSAEDATAQGNAVPVFNEQVYTPPAFFIRPLSGQVANKFSMDTLQYSSTMADWRTHNGIDIAASIGTKVMAISAGTVESVTSDPMMGTTVVIDHGDGLKSIYANLAELPTVEAGDNVEPGQVIGSVGDTALAEIGDVQHLHLSMILDGAYVDPGQYLPD